MLHNLLTVESNVLGQLRVSAVTMGVNMAYIEKRVHSSGIITYRARVRQSGAPEKTSSFRTRKEATVWAQKMEAEIRAGRYFGKEEDREKTFAEFVDRYIEKELPKNPKGYAKQKALLTWWKTHLGKFFLCHITPSMIAALRDKLLSETTRRHKLRTPSTTLQIAILLH